MSCLSSSRGLSAASVLFCGLLCFVLPGAALGQGMGGLPSDRLDWSGSPTDRYLEPSEIRTVLHDATETFYECFREHVRGGAAADQVAVTFRVPRSGRADQVVVDVDSSETRSSGME